MRRLRTCLAAMALTFASLAATTSAQAAPPPSSTAQSSVAQHELDFRVPGVIIWSTPIEGARRLGLGSPGQGFELIKGSGPWEYYTCDNGVTTTYWLYGRNIATRVEGYVPDCNIRP